MKPETMESKQESIKPISIRKGLLMSPMTAGVYSNTLINKHKRAGSTGTTGDESYTTDEEDNVELDEQDCSIKDHVTKNLFSNHNSNDFGLISDISTITDKVVVVDKVERINGMHRNSSDSSVYSDLLEKCVDEIDLAYSTSDHESSSNGQGPSGDQVDWTGGEDNEFNELSYSRLRKELQEAHHELRLRDEEVDKLTRIRRDVESELEDLTASLFQEAHNMVREANEKQAAAEKALKESQMKVDVLTAEVAALKTLVLTSTPSRPNPHLHPQIDPKGKEDGVAIFTKKHRRSPSHFNLKYGRENSPPESPIKEVQSFVSTSQPTQLDKDLLEVDPVLHEEFLAWKQKPTLDKTNPFVRRVYEEDIDLCLKFSNWELSKKVRTALEAGTIFIEAINDKNKTVFPKKCALLEVPRQCFYRMSIGEPETWYYISQICRNRIIAVCDFLNYLKYIEGGLVKSSAHDVYWEVARLRKEIVLARLGLNLSS
ncbi:guanine nucleotide exchange factor for Rab-3A-like [Onthophagus taurus]|uniref:guanine nucleotide exchange factor for Rab-3A-like n=1 Tax=Onthophagus taurus TaxID=166361 RepID=UPI000C20E1E2|nr:guanine nucleotide exchange factor for Rab-3A-like [Onthophagus taurus]